MAGDEMAVDDHDDDDDDDEPAGGGAAATATAEATTETTTKGVYATKHGRLRVKIRIPDMRKQISFGNFGSEGEERQRAFKEAKRVFEEVRLVTVKKNAPAAAAAAAAGSSAATAGSSAATAVRRTRPPSAAAATTEVDENLLRRVAEFSARPLFRRAGSPAYATAFILHKLCGGWNQAIALAHEHFGLVETKKNLQSLRQKWWCNVLTLNQQDEFNAAVKNLKNQT
ncbi:hypothetical protein RI054_25g106980 [Pseudoscourfieldia marina]